MSSRSPPLALGGLLRKTGSMLTSRIFFYDANYSLMLRFVLHNEAPMSSLRS
jgi:hypothetical protein